MTKPIFGKLLGLKKSDVQHLERLERRRVPKNLAVSPDLAQELAALTVRLNRRIGLYVDRGGHVLQVILGSATHLEVPDPGPDRAGPSRLRGVRLIETVLDGARGDKGDKIGNNDLADLLHFRLDCLVEVVAQKNGTAKCVRTAHLLPPNPEGRRYEPSGDIRPGELPDDFDEQIQALEQEFAQAAPRVRAVKGKERALVIALVDGQGVAEEDAVAEISELARSAGAAVVDRMAIRVRHVEPRTYIGKGQAEEVELRAIRCDADFVTFDRELSPVQARNLEEQIRFRVVDRTALILDIFAQRAQSTDGKLQVELARLKYFMPRVANVRQDLARIRGGIGSNRGAGETKAQLTRQRLRDRIADLDRRITDLSKRRNEQRKQRSRNQTRVVSLVGYTNAGKSTLFNALTGATTIAEDKLFATLDPTARRLHVPPSPSFEYRETVLTDTVGFIRDLPVDLVNAFRATLEGLQEADLLIHVADASNPAVLDQIEAVDRTLKELSLSARPQILLFNKRDRIASDDFAPIAARFQGLLVSAIDPNDQREIRRAVSDALESPQKYIRAPAFEATDGHASGERRAATR